MSSLTAKQRDFAHYYSQSHNGAKAAFAAGYSERRARRTNYKLLKRPNIAQLVEKLDVEKREASGVDEPWVVGHLTEIVERSMAGRPRTNGLGELILDHRTGEPIVDADFTNANRALATLSKIAGLQVRKSAVDVKRPVVYTLNFDRDLKAEAERDGREWR